MKQHDFNFSEEEKKELAKLEKVVFKKAFFNVLRNTFCLSLASIAVIVLGVKFVQNDWFIFFGSLLNGFLFFSQVKSDSLAIDNMIKDGLNKILKK